MSRKDITPYLTEPGSTPPPSLRLELLTGVGARLEEPNRLLMNDNYTATSWISRVESVPLYSYLYQAFMDGGFEIIKNRCPGRRNEWRNTIGIPINSGVCPSGKRLEVPHETVGLVNPMLM